MSAMTKLIGLRIRNYRIQSGRKYSENNKSFENFFVSAF